VSVDSRSPPMVHATRLTVERVPADRVPRCGCRCHPRRARRRPGRSNGHCGLQEGRRNRRGAFDLAPVLPLEEVLEFLLGFHEADKADRSTGGSPDRQLKRRVRTSGQPIGKNLSVRFVRDPEWVPVLTNRTCDPDVRADRADRAADRPRTVRRTGCGWSGGHARAPLIDSRAPTARAERRPRGPRGPARGAAAPPGPRWPRTRRPRRRARGR
jgi:hypothetical protein